MKLVIDNPAIHDPIKSAEIREAEKELRFIGDQKRNPGHIIWKYNQDTFEISRADFVSEVQIGIDRQKKRSTKIQVEANHFYFQALNYKNAVKNIRRRGWEVIEKVTK